LIIIFILRHQSKFHILFMTNLNTSSPTTQAVALVATLASALAISIALHKSKKGMPAKDGEEAAAAAAAATRDPPNLPPRFAVGTFVNSRSQSLFTINLPPMGKGDASSCPPPRAMLVLAHGIGEHCCRPGYVGLFESLSGAGVDAHGLDHHGHGRSDGAPRGYADKFDDYVSDLIDYVRHCRGKYADRGDACPPLVLMGQSMGGLVCVMAALSLGSDQVGGIILTSPALGVDMDLILKFQKFFAPAIDKFLPKARIVDAVDPRDLSRNPAAVRAYIDDPLIEKGKLVARTAIGMDKAFDVVRARRGEIACPVLLLHGTDDRVTSQNASLDFFRNIGSTRKRYLRLRGYFHELFDETGAEELVRNIVGFASAGGSEFADIYGEEEEAGLVDVEFKNGTLGPEVR
jgi:acylglycerol lipase